MPASASSVDWPTGRGWISAKDVAVITRLAGGACTVHVKGKQYRGGDCIVEGYDAELD